ncbi:MAG: ABC transporter permease [Saprospiraceae bacterium]|nr:ABC transporter permease [Saprospiraceae bacterium]
MNFRLILDISRSMMMARWQQTLVAAIGVTFSITMFISLLGFMNGLNDMLDGLVLNRTPHIRLYNDIKPTEIQPIHKTTNNDRIYAFINSVKASNSRMEIDNSAAIMKVLNRDNRIKGICPRLNAQVLFRSGTIDITGMVNGIEARAESELFSFGDYVNSGKAIDLQFVPNSIILGKGLAEKLLVVPGDMVQLTTAGGERLSLKVVAFFQSGIADYDKVQSFTSIQTVQKLLGKPNNHVSDIQIKLHDMSLAPMMAKEFHTIYGTDAEDIQSANAQFETGSFVRNIISYAVGITLLIVAGFGIYNILNMMIYEKMDSIAILKATGFSGKDVRSIFLSIALSIGLAGGLLGLLFGLIFSRLIDKLPFETQALPTITTYPVNYDLKYYVTGLTFALITTFLAGYFPSRKASSIDPVIIIRGK